MVRWAPARSLTSSQPSPTQGEGCGWRRVTVICLGPRGFKTGMMRTCRWWEHHVSRPALWIPSPLTLCEFINLSLCTCSEHCSPVIVVFNMFSAEGMRQNPKGTGLKLTTQSFQEFFLKKNQYWTENEIKRTSGMWKEGPCRIHVKTSQRCSSYLFWKIIDPADWWKGLRVCPMFVFC